MLGVLLLLISFLLLLATPNVGKQSIYYLVFVKIIFLAVSASQPIWRAATTSTQDKISIAKSWLHDYESKHQKCKPLATQMPKRLTDVGSLGGVLLDLSCPKICIIEISDMPP